ncbi:MAG: tRNA (adenosine(37)-N6)-dimethylallyltransferase MiaA [Bacteroidota bacterium]
MPQRKTLLAIVGPTASGKTRLALILAKRLNAEIVSADSRQLYQFLTIGTSKPTEAERSIIPHHWIDVLDPREPMSAGLFGKQVRMLLGEIRDRGKTPILAGGSGLYVKAVIDGLFHGPPADRGVRTMLEKRLSEAGISGLFDDLRRVDPRTAAEMQKEPKARRIQRALEVYYATGVPLSGHFERQEKENPLDCIQIGLQWKRNILYQRIDERVEAMMKMGFLDEVHWLRDKGYGVDLNSLNTVGYKEMFAHLQGHYDLSAAIELIKRNTRRFAKRQETWFKADRRIHWINMDEDSDWERIGDEAERLFVRGH